MFGHVFIVYFVFTLKNVNKKNIQLNKKSFVMQKIFGEEFFREKINSQKRKIDSSVAKKSEEGESVAKKSKIVSVSVCRLCLSGIPAHRNHLKLQQQ